MIEAFKKTAVKVADAWHKFDDFSERHHLAFAVALVVLGVLFVWQAI